MDIRLAVEELQALKVCHQKNKKGLEAIDEVLRGIPSVVSEKATVELVENMTLKDSIANLEHLGQTLKHANRVEKHFKEPVRMERNIRAIENTVAAAKRLDELIAANILSDNVLPDIKQ